jgi:hypothetical protein
VPLRNHPGRAISFPCYPTPPNPPRESFGAFQHNHQTRSAGKKNLPDSKSPSYEFDNQHKLDILALNYPRKQIAKNHKCSTEPIQGYLDWGGRIVGTGIKEFGSKGRAEVPVHRGWP